MQGCGGSQRLSDVSRLRCSGNPTSGNMASPAIASVKRDVYVKFRYTVFFLGAYVYLHCAVHVMCNLSFKHLENSPKDMSTVISVFQRLGRNLPKAPQWLHGRAEIWTWVWFQSPNLKSLCCARINKWLNMNNDYEFHKFRLVDGYWVLHACHVLSRLWRYVRPCREFQILGGLSWGLLGCCTPIYWLWKQQENSI